MLTPPPPSYGLALGSLVRISYPRMLRHLQEECVGRSTIEKGETLNLVCRAVAEALEGKAVVL